MAKHFSGTFEGTISGGGGWWKGALVLGCLLGVLALVAPAAGAVAAGTGVVAGAISTALLTIGLYAGAGAGVALAVGGGYWLVRRIKVHEDERPKREELRQQISWTQQRRAIPMPPPKVRNVEATRLDKEVR